MTAETSTWMYKLGVMLIITYHVQFWLSVKKQFCSMEGKGKYLPLETAGATLVKSLADFMGMLTRCSCWSEALQSNLCFFLLC